MAKNTCYIILFKDGSYHLFNKKINKADVQDGARCFACKDETPIVIICSWIAQGYPESYGSYIKEVKEW